jgi:hypothetical protein
MTTLPDQTTKIRALNDRLREMAFNEPATYPGPFKILVTQGCQAISTEDFAELAGAIAGFTDFDDGNDPHGEHDFGAVTVAGERYFFKIDYYDLAMSAHSPDPADAARTIRVLTIMRADEY